MEICFHTATYETYVEKRKILPFAELLERWTNDAPTLDDTVSAHPDIGQVASDDAVIHDNSLRTPGRKEDVVSLTHHGTFVTKVYSGSGTMH